MTDRPFKYVGKSLPRADARDSVTGRTKYTADLNFPGVLLGKVLRSTVPHARIVSVDTAAAREIPGVVAVLTAADLPALVKETRFGPVLKDMPILAEGRVRYEGEPVALIIAEDDLAADEALESIWVEYEDLPVITDIDAALAPGAVVLHPDLLGTGQIKDVAAQPDLGRNICHQYHYTRGNTEAVFATADHVFEHTYTTPMMYHVTMENPAAVAMPEGDGLTIHVGTQYPFLVRQMVAGILGWDLNRVRIVVPAVGGAFGSKEYMNIIPLAVVGALAAAAPVRLELSLEEAFRSMARHGSRVRLKTAVSKDGVLLARQCEVHMETGAYADSGPRVMRQAAYRVPGPYRFEHLQVDAYCVYTNKVVAGAYRGFGATQATFAYESQMDEIAHALGIDPVQLRLKNLLQQGDDFMPGDTPIDGDLPKALQVAAARAGWSERPARPGRALGVAACTKNTASGPLVSQAMVRLNNDASATLLVGTAEIGQGAFTVLRQICAEELDLPPERIRVPRVDTETTPFDQRTSSSRSTVQMGLAVQRAAQDVRRQLLDTAGKMLGTDPAQLVSDDGVITGPAGQRLGYKEVVASFAGAFGSEVIGLGSFKPSVIKGPPPVNGQVSGFWEINAAVAGVAVDLETGEVKFEEFITVTDAGRCINPATAHGQETGGTGMGVGQALFEACHYEDGYFRNPNLVEYRVPLATDVPSRMETIAIENGDGPGPYGAKGMGESSILTVGPSVANALFRATGVRLRNLPLTPESVWRALRSHR